MDAMKRVAAWAALTALVAGAAGCGTLSRLNPFGGDDETPTATAASGKRIAVVAFDQTVTAAEARSAAMVNEPYELRSAGIVVVRSQAPLA